jgi:DNA processing protein
MSVLPNSLLFQSKQTNTEKEVHTWLRLNNAPKLGVSRLLKSAQKLSCNLAGLVDLVDLAPKDSSQLKSIGWSDEQIDAMSANNADVLQQLAQTINWLSASDKHHFVTLSSPHYPPLLKQISRPPLFLFVRGELNVLAKPQIAFVGSRKASLSAVQITNEMVRDLANKTHAATVSGLALGIDAACHRASLANKVPTIGVLGCGVDVIYPKRHKSLYDEITQQGAVVSEFLLGTQAVAPLFPRRNRIISGLSHGTVVVEARIKSGSLVTAKYALEQNRDVFAVPSNIHNPNAEGCHWLIKQGAKLTTSIDDVLEELPDLATQSKKVEKKPSEPLASDLLLDSVGYSATSVDLIAKRSGMSLSDVLIKLLEYELRGLVASSADGYIKLRA